MTFVPISRRARKSEYHVPLQTFKDLDCFGEGGRYAGELVRAVMHHKTAAPCVMTQQGAAEGTRYMRALMRRNGGSSINRPSCPTSLNLLLAPWTSTQEHLSLIALNFILATRRLLPFQSGRSEDSLKALRCRSQAFNKAEESDKIWLGEGGVPKSQSSLCRLMVQLSFHL
jgi:hypothetical protein